MTMLLNRISEIQPVYFNFLAKGE